MLEAGVKQGADMSIELAVVRDMAGLRDLEAAWDALACTDGNGDFYVSYMWFNTFLRNTSQPPEQLHILVCRHANRIVAIIPLCFAKLRMRVYELRALELIGNVYSPFRSALVERRMMPQVVEALVNHLLDDRMRKWDILKLDDISGTDPFVNGLIVAVKRHGMAVRNVPGETNVCVDLTGYTGAAEYFSSLKKNFRQNIRTSINRMNKSGRFQVVLAHGDREELDSAMDDYYLIYTDSWKEPESDPDFHRKLAHAMAAENRLRLFQLYFRPDGISADGSSHGTDQLAAWSDRIDPRAPGLDHEYKPIASVYFIVHDRTAYCLKMSYRGGYEKFGPGTVLLWYAIQHLIEQDTIRTIDFQKGDDAYKLKWGGSTDQRCIWYVYNKASLAARMENACETILVPLARRLKRIAVQPVGVRR